MVSLNKKSLTFILYDWATSPITTIHTTFIFSVYFVEKIMPELVMYSKNVQAGKSSLMEMEVAEF